MSDTLSKEKTPTTPSGKPVAAATGCSRHWRSVAFWHSDIEDAVDRTVCDADHYEPESRAKFLRDVIAALAETASKLEAENEKAMAAPSKESQQQQAPSALAISGLLACHDCGWRGNPEDTTWTDIERNETDGESPEDQRSCPECLSINLSDQAG